MVFISLNLRPFDKNEMERSVNGLRPSECASVPY